MNYQTDYPHLNLITKLSNFQPILDCFIPNFKLKYEDSENIKADRVSTVVSTYVKSNVGRFFFGTPGICLLYL